MSSPLTRRATIVGAVASSAALAVPALALSDAGEHPWVKARRLARELAETLNYVDEANWRAWVVASTSVSRPVMFENMAAYDTPRGQIDHYTLLLGQALKRYDPTVGGVSVTWTVDDEPPRLSGLSFCRAKKSAEATA
jgi:hypothetical protein